MLHSHMIFYYTYPQKPAGFQAQDKNASFAEKYRWHIEHLGLNEELKIKISF